jgi:hypothetical protein
MGDSKEGIHEQEAVCTKKGFSVSHNVRFGGDEVDRIPPQPDYSYTLKRTGSAYRAPNGPFCTESLPYPIILIVALEPLPGHAKNWILTIGAKAASIPGLSP